MPSVSARARALRTPLLDPVEGRCLAIEIDRGEEPESVRLVAALAVLLGEVEGLGGERERTLGLANLHMGLGEASQPERMIGLELHGRRPLDRLLEERQRLADPPEVRIRRARRMRRRATPWRRLRPAREADRAPGRRRRERSPP